MKNYEALRRITLDRRKSRKKIFASTKAKQTKAQPPKKHKLRNAMRILLRAEYEITNAVIPF